MLYNLLVRQDFPETGGREASMGDKKAAAVQDRRAGHALELFEKAVKALGKKDFERASGLLDELIESYPEERDLLERARAFRTLCERSREKRHSRLKSFEDLLNYGVILHNKGDFEGAIKHLQQAAEIHPRNEHVLYCLAAAQARAGDSTSAIKALKSAISVSPANRAQARSDSDFDSIRDEADFVSLVYSQAS
jgi:tetratricopeptide (TPR) repeat protein